MNGSRYFGHLAYDFLLAILRKFGHFLGAVDHVYLPERGAERSRQVFDRIYRV